MTDRSILPPSINDARYRAFEALGQRLDAIDLAPLLVYRVRAAQDDVLRSLSWQFHVQGLEGWDLARTHDQRVALIERAILLHRHRGTPGGVEMALALAGLPSARVHDRLGSAAMPAAHYDGVYRYDGETYHDGNSVAPDRGWAIFGVSFDAGDLTFARAHLNDIRSLIRFAKRAVCHLAWIRPEQRLVDVLPPPTDSQQLIARAAVADRLLPGPRYDGAYAYGGAVLPRHDDVIRYDGAVTHDGSPLVTAPSQIRYGRPLMADAVTITVCRAISSPLDAPAHHDGALRHDGSTRYTGRRSALSDRMALTAPGPALTAGPYPATTAPTQAITAGPMSGGPNPTPGITAGPF